MSSEESAVGAKSERNLFLNYWNLGQSFLIGGKSTLASINQFIEVVQRRNPHIKILEGARITEKLTDEETT